MACHALPDYPLPLAAIAYVLMGTMRTINLAFRDVCLSDKSFHRAFDTLDNNRQLKKLQQLALFNGMISGKLPEKS